MDRSTSVGKEGPGIAIVAVAFGNCSWGSCLGVGSDGGTASIQSALFRSMAERRRRTSSVVILRFNCFNVEPRYLTYHTLLVGTHAFQCSKR